VAAYRVTFPGPIGPVNGGLAATLVYAEPAAEDLPVEGQIGEQVAAYLRGIRVSASRLHCEVSLLKDGSSGTGSVWTVGTRGRRIGTFHLERIGNAEPAL
jgi:hypothetical protein